MFLSYGTLEESGYNTELTLQKDPQSHPKTAVFISIICKNIKTVFPVYEAVEK